MGINLCVRRDLCLDGNNVMDRKEERKREKPFYLGFSVWSRLRILFECSKRICLVAVDALAGSISQWQSLGGGFRKGLLRLWRMFKRSCIAKALFNQRRDVSILPRISRSSCTSTSRGIRPRLFRLYEWNVAELRDCKELEKLELMIFLECLDRQYQSSHKNSSSACSWAEKFFTSFRLDAEEQRGISNVSFPGIVIREMKFQVHDAHAQQAASRVAARSR